MVEQLDSPARAIPLLCMRGIKKRFGATIALDGVDLCVHAGEVHAIVGENGAGKSTLMKILSRAVVPDSGSIQINGRSFQPRHPMDARRAGVAMIYQELSLAPHLSVEENIMLGMEQTRCGLLRKKTMREQTREALRILEHPDIHPESRVGDLPTAAQQLVEIARALAIGCRVLVLDEPTSSLTRDDALRLFQIIKRLKQQNHALIYISHFLDEVQQVADRVTVLRDGRTAGTRMAVDTSFDDMIRMMIGERIEHLYPHSRRTPGEVILDISELAGRKKPVSAGLNLRRGEVVGIAGLVGAGRTEFLRVLFGLDPIRKGKIRIGLFFGPALPTQRWKQNMGLVSENRTHEGLALSLRVSDNLTLSKLGPLGPGCTVLPCRQSKAGEHWIKQLHIRCSGPDQKVSDLSGGNQQKVAVARLLYHDVDILLLDEPTRGIDIASKSQIYQLIDELVSERHREGRPPKAILMISNYLPELLGVCDRVAVMRRGRLGPVRPVREINEQQLMLEATRGEQAFA